MTDRLLDLPPGIGQRASTFYLDVLTTELEWQGRIHPQRTPAIRNNTAARVMRTMTGLSIRADEYRDLNPLRDLVRAVFELEDGRRWAMGVFVFADDDQNLQPGSAAQLQLHDQHDLLAQPFVYGFSLQRGSLIVPRLVDLLRDAGVARINQPEPDVATDTDPGGPGASRVGQDIIYFPGDDRADAARRLALMAGLLPPWFDRDGVCQLVPPPPLETAVAAVTYSTTDPTAAKVADGSMRANLVDAPNVFVVANSGATEDAIVGRARIDANQPHSVENRGREIVDFERVQGLESAADARRMAQVKAVVHASDYTEVTYTGPPDPRHDTFDVVAFNGVAYREIGWDLQCSPGGRMTHQLNRAGLEEPE